MFHRAAGSTTSQILPIAGNVFAGKVKWTVCVPEISLVHFPAYVEKF